MSDELVKTENNDVAVIDPDAAAFLQEADKTADDNLDRVPRLVIKQKEEFVGRLFCEELGEAWDSGTFVLMKHPEYSRIMWPETYKKDNDPVCKSNDGITPVTGDDKITPMADDCKSCPHSKWTKGDDGNNVPPDCNEVINLLLLTFTDPEEMLIPMYFSVKSTSIGPTNKQLLNPLKLRRISLNAKRKRAGLPPAHECMFAFDIKTLLKENDKGDAYIPQYSGLRELSDDEKALTVAIAAQCQQFTPNIEIDDRDQYGDGKEDF